jgi:hypothetical protein
LTVQQSETPLPKRLEAGLWYTLMLNLLYPAVLGSIFYSLLGFVLDPSHYTGDWYASVLLLLSLAVISHFCVDFLYISLLREYNFRQFTIDFVIVALLYRAFLAIDPSAKTQDVPFFFLLFTIIHAIFFPQEIYIWLNYNAHHETAHARIHRRMIAHTAFCILAYFLCFYFFSSIPSSVLVLVVLATSIHYGFILKLRYELEMRRADAAAAEPRDASTA